MPAKLIFSKDQIGNEARYAINGQRYRCGNKNAPSFRYYGAKGIKVLYSSKDFYEWFKKERLKIPLNISASVDRLNSNGHYELGNIRLVTIAENTAESNSRRRKITIFHILLHLDEGLNNSQIARLYNMKPHSILKQRLLYKV